MKLRKTVQPVAPKGGAGREHFYDGELKTFNDVAETDNPNWIRLLIERGYTPEEEMTNEHRALYGEAPIEASSVGEVTQEEEVEPLGTQVVDETNYDDFIEGVEAEQQDDAQASDSQASGPVDQSHTDEPFQNDPPVEDASNEPSEIELMLFETLNAAPKKRGK